MAEASDLRERMERMLECPICIDQFVLPKVLPCQHTYCKRCLEDLWDKNKSTLKCPNCRRRQRVPKNGIDGFPPNVTISELIEVQKSAGQQGTQTREVDPELDAHLEHLENSARYLRGVSEACDEGVVISQRGESVKAEISYTFKRYRDILKDRETHLKKKVDIMVEADSANRAKWREMVQDNLDEAGTLIQSVNDVSDDTSTLGNRAANLSREILKVATSMPVPSQYHFTYGRQVMRTHITHYGSIVVQESENESTYNTRGKRKSIITEDGEGDSGKPIVVDYFPSQKPLWMTDLKPETENGLEFSPFAVAITPSGNIIATDLENHRAIIFTPHLERITEFGKYGDGKGELNRPTGIATDTEGSIFIADQVNNRVQVFDSFGRYKSQFGKRGSEAGEFVFPCGLCFDKHNRLFVCDSGNFRVQIFERNGTPLFQFGSRDQFVNQPMHLSLTSSDNVIVTDQKYIRVFTKGQEKNKLYMNQLSGVAVDHFGNMIVGDSMGQLVVLRETGEELCRIGTCGKSPGQFIEPRGIAVTKDGNIVVGDGSVHRIQIFAVSVTHDENDNKE